ncbi:MAG: YdcF family protein [Bacteroidia bacterium]|nr:YdcF family protein [Bacteroidia bacterium]MCZ2248861.1 YdcF family protein [Bacteroidia bacterium]
MKSLNKNYEAAIVLGGVSFWDHEINRIQFGRSSDRVFQALELYHLGYVKKIILVGGSGSINYPEDKESIEIKDYLMNLGYKSEDIIIESQSRNTHENAKYTKQVIDSLGMKGPYIMVTSGFHMKRAQLCFQKYGIESTPYSTDRYSGELIFDPGKIFIPNTGSIQAWDVYLHEILGLIIYYFKGYI